MESPIRDELKRGAQTLAAQNVFVGTSSWKYPGWCGMLYDDDRYIWRGNFAKSRFEKDCLGEYAEVFKAVCVDAAYYTFPTMRYLEGLAAQVPSDFQFAFKVTDAITIKKFSKHARFGPRGGTQNVDFLNADAFQQGFLTPLEAIRPRVGLLIFEFSRFYPPDFEHGRDFVAALDAFFEKLPHGWSYGVEIRNKHWLKPDYFACLARHKVTHVFNSWTEMPPVSEQMQIEGSETNPDLVAARFLLKPGRTYEESVKSFEPYSEVKDVYEDARRAAVTLIVSGLSKPGGKIFIFVNNRLEGNALQTIRAILQILTAQQFENPH